MNFMALLSIYRSFCTWVLFFRFKVNELYKTFGRDGHPDMRAQVTASLSRRHFFNIFRYISGVICKSM